MPNLSGLTCHNSPQRSLWLQHFAQQTPARASQITESKRSAVQPSMSQLWNSYTSWTYHDIAQRNAKKRPQLRPKRPSTFDIFQEHDFKIRHECSQRVLMASLEQAPGSSDTSQTAWQVDGISRWNSGVGDFALNATCQVQKFEFFFLLMFAPPVQIIS